MPYNVVRLSVLSVLSIDCPPEVAPIRPAPSAARAFLTAGGWIACGVLALLSGGCPAAGRPLVEIQGAAEFTQQVLKADRPVIVEFYKVPCPTCDVEQALLEQLAEEYDGRVKFYKFQVANMTWDNICPEIKERYQLYWVPSVLLFYNGWERQRWELNHPIGEYRAGINAIVAEAARRRPTTTWPAARPATPRAPAPTARPTVRSTPGPAAPPKAGPAF